MEITPQDQPRRRRPGRLLLNVVCTAVSLLAIGFILPAAFGLERYVIAGGSMTGSISRGSVVLEEVVPVADLRVGDVITYMPPADSGIDNLVTHRIVSIKGDAIRTKGDANPQSDPWTFELTAATQPRAVADVPYVGYAILALQDADTRKVVIGGPAALVALFSLRDLVLGLRRRRKISVPTAPETDPGPDLTGNPQRRGPGLPATASPPVVLVPAQPGADEAGAVRVPSRRPVRAPRTQRRAGAALTETGALDRDA